MTPQAPANNNALEVAAPKASHLFNQSPSAYTHTDAGVKIFHAPGYIVELRALRNGEVYSILYEHHELDELLQKARELNAQGYACYHTINPLKLELRKTAGDEDVARLAWLPYDIDPVRETGTASTDAEKAEAWKVARSLVKFWEAREITPAVVDSGNGYYVLVPIDLAVEDSGWVVGVLNAHAAEFSTPAAKVDTTTSNPSRILRVPGTMNIKGANTPERPHREAKILAAGSRANLADLKALPVTESKPLATSTPSPEKVKRIAAALRTNFARLSYPTYTELQTTQRDGVKFHDFRFSPCLMGAHNDGDDSCLIRIREDGILCFKCYHDSHTCSWKDVRPQLEAEYGKLDFGDCFTGTVTIGSSKVGPTPAVRKLQLTSFSSMQSRVIEWYWPGRLARGHITTFNGDPGTMKSFASIDVAARVTTGRAFPDGEKNPLPPSSVLVLTREDGLEDTVKPRFLAAGGNPRFLHTVTLDGSSETAVVKIEEHLAELDAILPADIRLIIFDPLIDFLKAGQNDEQAVRDVLTLLKQFAERRGLAVIGINHLNKKADLEAIHRTMGAKGMIGVARMNYLFGKDENGTRHMVPLKNNVWHEDGSLTFHVEDSTIEDGGLTITKIGRVAWDGKGDATADELSAPKKKAAIDLVGDWLKEVLKPAGTKRPADELYAAGQERGFSDDQVKRGLKRVNATYERTKTVPPKTLWYFPEVGW